MRLNRILLAPCWEGGGLCARELVAPSSASALVGPPLASEQMAPRGRLVFAVGLGSLLFVPVFKAITGLPPFLGMLAGTPPIHPQIALLSPGDSPCSYWNLGCRVRPLARGGFHRQWGPCSRALCVRMCCGCAGLGSLWLLTDAIHYGESDRQRLRVPQALSRIDTQGVLFFLGILLAVGR